MSRGDPCLQGLKSQVGFGVCYERGAKDLEMVTGVKHFCGLSSENPSARVKAVRSIVHDGGNVETALSFL